jgi:RimJ/RimL family protein N-acetyltransferase
MPLIFPSPLVTERLIVRAPTADDAAELNAAIHETWAALTPWMAWATELPSLEESRRRCVRMEENWAEGLNFPLFGFSREDGRLVLASGVYLKNPDVPAYEIGYWCRTSYQRQGYVQEAVRAIAQACLDVMDARRIEIRCDAENPAPQAVALRCGFRPEGELVNDAREGGRLRSTRIFAITRNDP